MPSLYEITGDLKSLNQLMESMVDEDGNPREPNEEELETMKEWFTCSIADFEKKFDNYCRFIKNLKIEATVADEERKACKSEIDRLSKRSKAFENRAKSVQGLMQFCMDSLKLKKYKTALFSAGMQNTQISIRPVEGGRLDKVPDEYLKPRELDTTAIKNAIKDGLLKQGDGTPLGETKLFFKDGTELKDVRWTQGETLVIK